MHQRNFILSFWMAGVLKRSGRSFNQHFTVFAVQLVLMCALFTGILAGMHMDRSIKDRSVRFFLQYLVVMRNMVSCLMHPVFVLLARKLVLLKFRSMNF